VLHFDPHINYVSDEAGIWKEFFTVHMQEEFDAVFSHMLANVPLINIHSLLAS